MLQIFLKGFGFVQSKEDSTPYVRNSGKAFVFIVVSVDDNIMSEDSDSSLKLVEKHFKSAFIVCADCKTEKFFGFFIHDNGEASKLNTAPIKKLLLQVFGMESYK